MDVVSITPQDEYQHNPLSDPLWREGYHFNGYDTETRVGVSISIGIRPPLKIVEEFITVQGDNPLLFLKMKKSVQNLSQLDVTMKPLEPLKKWNIYMKDSFKKIKDGTPSNATEDVEFDLCFESDMPVCGYSIEEETRYEQPGLLKGKVTLGNDCIEISGKGIRDHSWGIRDMNRWGEWYGLMGWIGDGSFLNLAYFKRDDTFFCFGWLKEDVYYDVHRIQIYPRFSGGVLKECVVDVETSKKLLTLKSEAISFVLIPLEEKGGATYMEELVRLDGGYAFIGYGG